MSNFSIYSLYKFLENLYLQEGDLFETQVEIYVYIFVEYK